MNQVGIEGQPAHFALNFRQVRNQQPAARRHNTLQKQPICQLTWQIGCLSIDPARRREILQPGRLQPE
jgi:hypothetical protein